VPIRIYSKLANDLLLAEEKSCAKLVSSGAIYNVYVECCRPDKPPRNCVFLAKEKDVVLAWAIIKLDKKAKWQFMVYVKKSYRRLGIGTKLYNRAKKYMYLNDKEITVYRTDNINTKFFDAIRNHH